MPKRRIKRMLKRMLRKKKRKTLRRKKRKMLKNYLNFTTRKATIKTKVLILVWLKSDLTLSILHQENQGVTMRTT
tara:strand:+ start:548 stop:772 length:225 start_codon:yes stop_codon:yes gene_type:complete